MKVLNLYFSTTGNTAKVAGKIAETVEAAGHYVDNLRITNNLAVELLDYDLIFIGSGVYEWLPGKPVRTFLGQMRQKYMAAGEIKPSSPRRSGKKVVVYCTYGGFHTGVNEAVATVKYMGQLFDHLGLVIISEWYLVGEYHGKLQKFSTNGFLGDIQGRPNAADLAELAERVKGLLQT